MIARVVDHQYGWWLLKARASWALTTLCFTRLEAGIEKAPA